VFLNVLSLEVLVQGPEVKGSNVRGKHKYERKNASAKNQQTIRLMPEEIGIRIIYHPHLTFFMNAPFVENIYYCKISVSHN
jgi:hypothetical protein